jgi:CubicO group peptidase (beta-lactamase class C family)
VLSVCITIAVLCPGAAAQVSEPSEWPRTSFVAQGLDPARWQSLVQRIEEGFFREIRCVLVVKDGVILAEQYFNGSHPDELIDVRSAVKSYTSALTGIAIDQGFIPGVETGLVGYFPEYEAALDDPKRDLTLRHALTMGFGLSWPIGSGSESDRPPTLHDSWILELFSRPMAFEPGTRFEYDSAGPSLLGPVIRRASGMTVPEFASLYLFEPLGISNYRWSFRADGHAMTHSGFWARPRDMAKIGQLYLQQGRWGDQQIVSQAWVEESTHAHLVAFPTVGIWYGYYWWREPYLIEESWVDSYYASGDGGNKILVLPAENLVVVVTATAYGKPWSHLQIRAMMERYIVPAVIQKSGSPSPEPSWIRVPTEGAALGLALCVLAIFGWPILGVLGWRRRKRDGKNAVSLATVGGAVAWLTAVVAALVMVQLSQESNLELLLNSGFLFYPERSTVAASWLLSLSALSTAILALALWLRRSASPWTRCLLTAVAATALCLVVIVWRWGMLAYWL